MARAASDGPSRRDPGGAAPIHPSADAIPVRTSRDAVDEPTISVILASFNQVSFVAAAIEGILIQRTPGPIEVIVADDASTDGTRGEIARLLASRPGLDVRSTPPAPNLGPTRNYFRAMRACRAPFVALLDGDDYWTHPDKLAVQSDFLASHPECPFCASNFHVLDMATGDLSPRIQPGRDVSWYSAQDVVLHNMPGNLSACMYRRSVVVPLTHSLRHARCGDWLLNVCAARDGAMAMLHEPMSVYRRSEHGMWASLSRSAQSRMVLDLIPEYDRLTEFRYAAEFARVADSHRAELEALHDSPLATSP